MNRPFIELLALQLETAIIVEVIMIEFIVHNYNHNYSIVVVPIV